MTNMCVCTIMYKRVRVCMQVNIHPLTDMDNGRNNNGLVTILQMNNSMTILKL